jgi:hypothetical protein
MPISIGNFWRLGLHPCALLMLLTCQQLYEEDAWIGHRDFDLKITQRVKMSMVREYAARCECELF